LSRIQRVVKFAMQQSPAAVPSSRKFSVTKLVRQVTSLVPAATSDDLEWPGVEALRFLALPSAECLKPSLPVHSLILITSPPEKVEVECGSVKLQRPFPSGSMVLAPSTSPVRWRWIGSQDSFHLYLEPALLTRVAAESFELSLDIPPLEFLNQPGLRATMLALDAELTHGLGSCRLLVESLTTILAVQLIRHLAKPQPSRQEEAALPRRKLDTVIEFIMANLDTGLTLTQMAAVTFLSPYHFARRFKIATGMPPHKFVVARRVERAKQLLREDSEFTLADVALRSGFSDQSQLSAHFKRIVGVTPRQFQLAARIA